ncbi:uncharacterized protein OCT59_000045 [Rhizophagus irregularis]|uniref:uncharacterized protein n=1 Tax=Rhizophagus irregularis TaxID=588596 RepID=UPI0033227A47|nr:hypothetical protein OCT59_000045 [Rhizophagus irregularis]
MVFFLGNGKKSLFLGNGREKGPSACSTSDLGYCKFRRDRRVQNGRTVGFDFRIWNFGKRFGFWKYKMASGYFEFRMASGTWDNWIDWIVQGFRGVD